MALKFLNKKGWHTGSLRNIENVWKAEQKHEAEQKKLEELRKQIHEERERSEFRLLQEQAGLVPKQERLDFLYDSGLAVGKGASSSAAGGSGEGFKALEEALPSSKATDSSANQSSAPGALFEDKPHSANDAWRKLHSDPLLMIRQREQDALARIKNNPVQMAMIRKSVVEKKKKEKSPDHKEHRKKHRQSSSKHKKHSSRLSDSEDHISKEDKRNRDHHRKRSDKEGCYRRTESDSEDELKEAESRERSFHGKKYRYEDQDDVKRNHDKSKRDKYSTQAPRSLDADKNHEKVGPASDHLKTSDKEGNYRRIESDSEDELKEAESREKNRRRQKYKYDDRDDIKRNHDKSKHSKYSSQAPRRIEADKNQEKDGPSSDHRDIATRDNRRRGGTSKLSEEERAARLREMLEDAELHEEQRWKRLKKAEENDTREATVSSTSIGRNFLDAAHKSIYGAEKGGSSTIEESVRRRAHYSQGRYESERNAFRR
ncbi:BTB and TAZ domain protein 3 isoform 1 [Hibiscus syriacus]|uniref:BTB and TAZ domain protein 3 isoform 1 n=1 Tax=Hibiscus syriacus TaxID=106335 RepID=A0A6A2Y146_HIBSY|nr:pre-mRNA-splicing factor CWC25 homolog isoform X1 [Hibiscus syriacus]XP_039045419.1 pre-mRNA-splicing factor CWC25 homolog isoform X1 [Hibiscus syriacus]XP_039045420.1 pre-mRNA-splicing factor CWC25 homolog isoform X1 [Hibiscus syriacus]XP_039045421.1 pre-mRNA-splicing factor CWC25 homolog isoform X1 [Hibiscus syriacus]KAE8663227.1 BTB and TAZ domain protein 3 isoform 1 [Hibiscus syriacus]